MTLYLRQVRNMRTSGTYILVEGNWIWADNIIYPLFFTIRLPAIVHP
jgi:hypothetical protein